MSNYPRRFLGMAVAVITLSGLAGVLMEAPAAADSDTFTSGAIGTSGDTPVFNQSGPWTMSWSYNCANFGTSGSFSADVSQPSGDLQDDVGPNEQGNSGSGIDYYFDSGAFQLSIISECDWSISVAPSGAAPNSTPVTYTSSQTGDSGDTQRFFVSSAWTMSWSYNCTNFGTSGSFSVDIVQPPGDPTFDAGPNEEGTGSSGVDTYTDTGTFSLDVISECDWSITVTSSGTSAPAPAPTPASAAPTAVGIASTPDGGGYWIAYSNGAVAPHGDAGNFGGVNNLVLNAPINHIVATPDGGGYWLVASDGGTFGEGDAQFYGSTGSMHLNAPVVDMAPTPDGRGYWLVGADGGISPTVTPSSMAQRAACV